MMFRTTVAALLGSLFLASAVQAQQKAHEHGHWQLNAALEGGYLHVELIAPGADVTGFEHEARTASEKAKVWKAREKLKTGDALILLPPAAGCSLEKADTDVAGMDRDDSSQNHKADKRDGHKESGNGGHKAEQHNEYHAEYVFACRDAAKLVTIGVAIFEAFPNSKEIEATVLTAKGQRAAELDRNNTVISLDGLL